MCIYAGYTHYFPATRNLSTTSAALATSRWQPELFWNLRSLHVSLSTSGSLTQNRVLNQILEPLGSLASSRIVSLRLTYLWCIDIPLIKMVARLFPTLTSLHLSCSENLDVSCCWTCFEDSSLGVTHSPIPNHYVNVWTLTVSLSAVSLLQYHETSKSLSIDRICCRSQTDDQPGSPTPRHISLRRRHVV